MDAARLLSRACSVSLTRRCLLLAVGDQRVLRLLECAQHGLLVVRERLACRRFGAAQPRARAAEIEPGPAQRRRHRPGARVGACRTGCRGRRADRGMPVTVTRGKRSAAATPSRAVAAASRRSAARTSGRRRSRPLGVAERQRLRQRRIGARRQVLRQLPGPHAGEHRERDARAAAIAVANRRQARFDRRHARRGAGDVLLLADTRVAPHLASAAASPADWPGSARPRRAAAAVRAARSSCRATSAATTDAHIVERRVEGFGVRRAPRASPTARGRTGRSPRTHRIRRGRSSSRTGSSVKPGCACSRTSTLGADADRREPIAPRRRRRSLAPARRGRRRSGRRDWRRAPPARRAARAPDRRTAATSAGRTAAP